MTEVMKEFIQKNEGEKIIEIEIERLRSFKNHPFQVKDDKEMYLLKESIEKYGILNPLIVRPVPDGVYEIISGHRRKHAAELLGYRKVPVLIRVMTEDESILNMVDSQNVYLLSQVDENDLKEFVDQGKGTATVTPTPQVVIDENKIERTDKKEEAAKTEKEKMPQTNMGAMVAILILALGGVAAYYYFKIYKPKKEEEEDFEEEGLEISDGLESINEDEFEDREEENE